LVVVLLLPCPLSMDDSKAVENAGGSGGDSAAVVAVVGKVGQCNGNNDGTCTSHIVGISHTWNFNTI
jgi:hypothetical protein